MQYKRTWLMAILVALALGGCSREEPAEEQTGQLPEDNVFSDQVQTLEKAEGVQQTLDAAAAKQRETLESQEQR